MIQQTVTSNCLMYIMFTNILHKYEKLYFCLKIWILNFFFMVSAEKLSIMAKMLRKLYKIENFWEVHEGADSGKISFKVHNY